MQPVSAKPDDAVSFIEPRGSSMVIAVPKPVNRVLTGRWADRFTASRTGRSLTFQSLHDRVRRRGRKVRSRLDIEII